MLEIFWETLAWVTRQESPNQMRGVCQLEDEECHYSKPKDPLKTRQ
jgi:hypothetical protein